MKVDDVKQENASAFSLERTDSGVAFLTIDAKEQKVNILTTAVMQELDALLDALQTRNDIKVLVFISGKDDNFIAGADVNEIKGITKAPAGAEKASQGQAIFRKISALPYPVIAAIQGACVGGGLELALACHYRIARSHPKTRIGLPEVQLGILPGFGGTQRLPRLIGIQKALGLILTGRLVSAQTAGKLGLVDKVLPADHHGFLKAAAEEFAHAILSKSPKPADFANRSNRRLPDTLIESTAFGRGVIFNQARSQVLKTTKGRYPAPLKALEAVKSGIGRSLPQGLAIEARLLGELIVTDVSKNLISIFQLTERLKKDKGVDRAKIEAAAVNNVSIVGAGVMGGGIAQLLAYNDIPVKMKDIDDAALGIGYRRAEEIFDKAVRKHKMTPPEKQKKMALISGSLEYTGFTNTDFVIEAIVEDLAIKKKVFAEIETKVSDRAILASNTSSLSITEIASAVKKPERVIGLHFFNPVHRMPLVEIIRGSKTSDATTATAVAFAKRLGKIVIVVKDSPGFLVNRILGPYINEGALLLEDGVPIDEIDNAMVDFGMPMGPLNLLDEVGIDVGFKVAKILSAAFKQRVQPSAIIEKVHESGRLGKKSGRGFYVYSGKGKRVDAEVYNIINYRSQTNKFSKEDIQERLVFIMLKEAALCLAEKIVRSPGDLDAGLIFGAGFPPFHGGLLRYADNLGLHRCLTKMQELARQYGERFAPPELLHKLATKGERFYGVNSGE